MRDRHENDKGEKQMTSLAIPKLDQKKVRAAVEKELEAYRFCLLTLDESELPKMTQSFSLIPPSHTNAFHSKTEEAAVHNVDRRNEKRAHINRVVKAVSKLTETERAIVVQRYLQEDETFDYIIYNEMGLSHRQYYRIKARAFYKLALALKLPLLYE